MPWQDLAAVAALIVATAHACFTFGILWARIKSLEQEIQRARDRVDRMEQMLMEWMAYWKKQ